MTDDYDDVGLAGEPPCTGPFGEHFWSTTVNAAGEAECLWCYRKLQVFKPPDPNNQPE